MYPCLVALSWNDP